MGCGAIVKTIIIEPLKFTVWCFVVEIVKTQTQKNPNGIF